MTRRWKRLWIWLSAAALGAIVLGAAVTWLITAPRPAMSADATSLYDQAGDPKRGQLVFVAGDCSSCHASPGQSDRLKLGGGIALASPYGTFRAPNISSDPVDGIGAWTVKDLGNALLSGMSPNGSHYYPVFPYASFAHMSVADVVDLMAYLRTLPAVHGRAPPHELDPLFQIRRFVGFWKLLYFRPGEIKPDPAHDPQWNRGRYLVEALGHCDECHSSRDLFGGVKDKTRFAGGQDPVGTGFYPNITPARIGHWSQGEIAEMLKTGNTPDHGRVGSSMADVVINTSQLPQDDRDAIAAYIKALPARPTPKP
ncbi:Diheme cytochrome c-type [Bradyrhizobium sp. ORS 285]|nr:Diheme cytochrome c-type [Bradyrhizobium sp. ORS 285]SMX60009.1 Diheme cytochrome c-type [Bradyrhizobium sp. ORS 285]